MNKKDWTYVVIAMIVISVIVSLITIKMSNSADLSLAPPMLGGTTVSKLTVSQLQNAIAYSSFPGTKDCITACKNAKMQCLFTLTTQERKFNGTIITQDYIFGCKQLLSSVHTYKSTTCLCV